MSSNGARPRLVVVGSMMVDLIAYADVLPDAGETLVGTDFKMGFGGKGANQAVTASRLGAEVAFVGRVGDDHFGELSLENLVAQRIDPRMVKRVPGRSTGVAPIWVDGNGMNRIVIVPGANEAISADTVRQELGQVEDADCVVCQLEIRGEAVEEAFRIGREWGALTILNPAPARSDAVQLFAMADWVVPNEHEFQLLWGAAPSDAAVLAAAAAWRCGVVVTLGERGAAVTSDGGVVRREPPPVAPVDTTGAGDAFVGGFAHALAAGFPLAAALELGNACGALSTQALGTQTSFPSREAVLAQLGPHGLDPARSQQEGAGR